MDGFSILAIKALDCLDARAVVTAENIANASTPGYRPMRLSFEEALRTAATRGAKSVAAFAPALEQAPAGGEFRLDLEVATASSTALRYAAVIEVLKRHTELQGLALRGNR